VQICTPMSALASACCAKAPQAEAVNCPAIWCKQSCSRNCTRTCCDCGCCTHAAHYRVSQGLDICVLHDEALAAALVGMLHCLCTIRLALRVLGAQRHVLCPKACCAGPCPMPACLLRNTKHGCCHAHLAWAPKVPQALLIRYRCSVRAHYNVSLGLDTRLCV
jgi:hypothetical protein